MKKKHLSLLCLLLLLPGVVFGSDLITRDMIQNGTDFSSFRCGRQRVRMGDSMQDVRHKCGEPQRETRIHGEPYPIWLYRLEGSDHVFVIVFGSSNLRVRRIHRARCPNTRSGSGCPLGI